MTQPRPSQQTVPFDAEEANVNNERDALRSHIDSTVRESALPSAAVADLLALHRQLAAPRTPLLPSMDLYHKDTLPQQRSIIDTLSPSESVPPPAPYPSEPPPPCPSVVPPVRLPRSEPPAGPYRSRTSSAPPPPSSVPPPDPSSSCELRRFSSAPPQSLGPTARAIATPFAATQPQPLSPDAQRRQAPTIPADAQSPSSLSTYDPTHPIPSLRLPTFGTETFGTQTARQQENRRIGGVAFVLLVSLLVVAGAVTGINYAATNRDNSPTDVKAAAPDVKGPRVVLGRLPADALVAPAASVAQVAQAVNQATAPKRTTAAPVKFAPKAEALPNKARADSMVLESPWQKGRSVGTTGVRTQKAKANANSRVNTKTLDTETPLIPD